MAGSTALAEAPGADGRRGAFVAWIVPTYRNARPVWRFIEQHAAQSAKLSRSEMTAEFTSGGRMIVYTADNDTAIRGEAFDLVIIDEAARIREETWTDAIMPTLADRAGRAMLISTPKGRNWFWREFVRGMSDGKHQASFTAPSSANPLPTIRAAAEKVRGLVSERTYRQEWLAEFVDDGSFFTNIDDCATAAPQSSAIAGHEYVIGVDWARAAGGDSTVFCVADATTQEIVHIARYTGQPYDFQLAALSALWRRFGECRIIAEANSMGGPLVERLQSSGLPVVPFVTTAASKHEIITGLELALDQRQIKVIPDGVMMLELKAYEKRERSGIPSYSAPEGMHDDCVIALALAWHGAAALPITAVAL